MPYEWEKNAEGGRAEKLPAGTHVVKIAKVKYEGKDGLFRPSQDGSPKMMVVFADRHGREAGLMITLSPKAAWVLARLMSAAGADLKRMDVDGVTPRHFADADFAEPQLLGRYLRVQVIPTDRPDWPDVEPLRRDPTNPLPQRDPKAMSAARPKSSPAAEPDADSAAEDDDTIPF
jgi:hypothetical protein